MNKMLSVSLLSLAALLAPLRAHAQMLCALGPVAPYDPKADMPPSAGAQADLKKVSALLCPRGCGKVLLFANATTPNTTTVTDGAGVSKIAYSPGFAASVRSSFGPIATFGIFAHGLGHHLDANGNRASWMKDSWDSELRADAWAGCAMAKADLSPSRVQAVLLAMSTYPSPHHPTWNVRRVVINEGYGRCGGRTLPPLGRERGEQASRSESRKDDALSEAAPSGCSGDKDCRNGRACVNSHCTAASERRRCGKDTDCPDPQECDAAGYCGGPAAEARLQHVPVKEEPPKPTGPMLAALQEQRPAAATAAAATVAAPAAAAPANKEVSSCHQSCDDVRNQCVDAVTSEANKCLAAVQSDPSYKACSCPNYPAGNVGCYHFCAAAYQRGNSCSASNLVRDCRADGDRCRAQCQ
jgi:hypothetical protein